MAQEPIGRGEKHSGERVREDLKDDASELGGMAKERAEARAQQEQERAAKTAKSASSAMNTAADQLRDDENAPDWMASAVSSAARQVDDLAGRLQNKSPSDVAREASRFGRENPTTFLIASAAAGFAAARFLRAGAEQQHQRDDAGSADDSWRNTQAVSPGGSTGAQVYGTSSTGQTRSGTWNDSAGSATGLPRNNSGDLS